MTFFRARPGRNLILTLAALACSGGAVRAQSDPFTQHPPELESGFRAMYELKFEQARSAFQSYEKAHPDDPLGQAAVAASYLYEEFSREGVFTSAFFLDDKKLLGGVEGPVNATLRNAFREANQQAREMAAERLKTAPRDPEGLFVETLADGMQADFEALIEKRRLSSLRWIRRANDAAETLLAVQPHAQDAYLALGAANYIIGCLPAYERFFLWFGGVRGDRELGMRQLERAAENGHYLKPFAKVLLALAAEREHRMNLARRLFADLAREFPENPVFAHELALAEKRERGN